MNLASLSVPDLEALYQQRLREWGDANRALALAGRVHDSVRQLRSGTDALSLAYIAADDALEEVHREIRIRHLQR